MRRLLIPAVLLAALISLAAVIAQNPDPNSTSSVSTPKRVRVVGTLAERSIRKKVRPREIGVEGDAVLKVFVGVDGKVQSVRSVSGKKSLVEAAIPAVLQWEFTPFLLNNKPVEIVTELTVHFEGTKH